MAEVKVKITADDQASAAISAVKGALTAMGAAWAAHKLMDYAQDAAMMAARYNTLGAAMTVVGNNAGYTGEQMRAFQTTLQGTGIAMTEARQTLTMMASAHIDLANSAKLARIAQDAAVIGGINSSEAFKSMIYGIQSAQVEVLRTIGLNVNFEESYKKLGKQLGKTTEELTETEKVQARTNAVMEKGKDIAGAYAEAMGTAGKQITSMQRYMDDMKVKVGEVFQDALTVAVEVYTGHLKQSNKEMDELTRKGQIAAWGKEALMVFAFVADGVQGLYLILKSMGLTAKWSFDMIVSTAMMAKGALTGDLSSVGKWSDNAIEKTKQYGAELMKLTNITSFQDTAKQFLANKEAAQKNVDALKSVEQARIVVGKASREEIAAREKAEQIEKKFLQSIKNTIDGVKDYISASKDLRKELLAVAGEQYSDSLKQQVALFNENKISVSALYKEMEKYRSVVNEIFDTRGGSATAGLKEAGKAIDEFRTKVRNTNSKEAKAGLVDILNAYKDASVNILEVEQQRFRTLLEGERKVANEFMTIMQAKRKELESLKIWLDDISKAYKEAIAPKVEYADNYIRYFGELDQLKAKQAEVAKITDPARRIEEYKKLITAETAYKDAVVVDGVEIIQAHEVQARAQQRINDLSEIMKNDVKAQGDAAEAAYNKSKAKIDEYQKSLISLDNLIAKTRTIKIDFSVDVSAVTRALDEIRQSALGQGGSSGGSSGGTSGKSSGGLSIGTSDGYVDTTDYSEVALYNAVGADVYNSWNGPSYAAGTDYVPKTGLALVHQGEKIVPASQNNGSVSSMTFGDVTISLPSITNQTSGAELARLVMPELMKLQSRYRKAA